MTAPMTDEEIDRRIAEAEKALQCLYLDVHESVADDVWAKTLPLIRDLKALLDKQAEDWGKQVCGLDDEMAKLESALEVGSDGPQMATLEEGKMKPQDLGSIAALIDYVGRHEKAHGFKPLAIGVPGKSYDKLRREMDGLAIEKTWGAYSLFVAGALIVNMP